MDTPHTLLKSVTLWCFAQVTWFAAMFNAGNLEMVFKFLSIVSVCMVMVINAKKFINAVKAFFVRSKKRRQ